MASKKIDASLVTSSLVGVTLMFEGIKPISEKTLRRRMARFNDAGRSARRQVTKADLDKVVTKKTPQTKLNAFKRFVSTSA